MVAKVKAGEIDDVIQWALENSVKLSEMSSNLEYYLHRLVFSKLLTAKDTAGAIKYANTHFGKFER
jgi:hypothetical protein